MTFLSEKRSCRSKKSLKQKTWIKVMTITIDLSPEIETALQTEAAKEGLAPDRFVVDTVRERLNRAKSMPTAPRFSKAESELMQRINEGLPVETWRQYHALIAERKVATNTSSRI